MPLAQRLATCTAVAGAASRLSVHGGANMMALGILSKIFLQFALGAWAAVICNQSDLVHGGVGESDPVRRQSIQGGSQQCLSIMVENTRRLKF